MKILFPNASINYPPADGPACHRYQLIKNLSELGHHVITLSPDENPLTDTRRKSPMSVCRAMREADVIYGRPGERPDAVTRMTLPPRLWLIPRRTAVVWEQNRALTISLSPKPRSPEEIREHLMVFRRAARRVDAAIGVCRQASEELHDLLGIADVCTIQNGSDPDLFRPDVPRAAGLERRGPRLQVGWIGSHANDVHHHELIKGLCRIVDAQKLPIDVHVFGRTETLFPEPQPASLRLHGVIPYFDLPAYLAGIDVGLVVYRRPSDGVSPLKLFDYLASGCIPMCTPGQSVEEVLAGGDAGWVRDWTPESLAGALLELSKDHSRMVRMSHAARRLVETTYNWRNITKRIETVLWQARERRANK